MALCKQYRTLSVRTLNVTYLIMYKKNANLILYKS